MEDLKQKIMARAVKARERAHQAKKELDQKILDLTSMRFDKVKQLLVEKQKKWESEGDTVYRLAEKVLNRARSVRESLSVSKGSEFEDNEQKNLKQEKSNKENFKKKKKEKKKSIGE